VRRLRGHKRAYLDYPTALERGWPIATGVIEGACRHLVKDRMDITGARWGLDGGEAVLKMRAIVSNGDFEEYWRYHLAHERGVSTIPAMPTRSPATSHLRPDGLSSTRYGTPRYKRDRSVLG